VLTVQAPAVVCCSPVALMMVEFGVHDSAVGT
jgi:hypothetical protein